MKVQDFVYQLPNNLIARIPPATRTESRLLCLEGETGVIHHQNFTHLLKLLNPGDLLVLNDTRVIPARLFGQKETGGRIEILVERLLGDKEALAHVRSNKPLKAGTRILLDTTQVECNQEDTIQETRGQVLVLGRAEHASDLFHLEFTGTDSVLTVLQRLGHMPLPPYIDRADDIFDKERYQTVYAQVYGAVAAPTAGLHFDQALLTAIQSKGVEVAMVTLHVGAGTFQPVRVENLMDHKMHHEWMKVGPEVVAAVAKTRARGGRVIAVGTTSVRCLETAAISGTLGAYEGETDLFITPGFNFQVVDAMLTNFHLPASTLLMLVCAFAGQEKVLAAYQAAIDQQYRFFSYGDAMFVTRGGVPS